MIMAFPPHDQSFTFQNQSHEHDPEHLIIPSSSTTSPNAFPPSSLHFEGGGGGVPCLMLKRSMSFSGIENQYKMMRDDEGEELEAWDHEGWRTIGVGTVGEKKKRLSIEQVKTLEKSFEAGNKLEGERKMQLANSLGLEPRQIAIWFQNRRARWKTKQLEKEYEALKRQFDSLKSQNHALKAHNLQLHAQLQALKGRDSSEEGGTMGQLKNETEICWSNGSEINSSDMINLGISRTQVISSPVLHTKPSTGITQLLQRSSTSQSQPQDESFSNMFHGIDDNDEHHNFLPWPDHHHHHFHH